LYFGRVQNIRNIRSAEVILWQNDFRGTLTGEVQLRHSGGLAEERP